MKKLLLFALMFSGIGNVAADCNERINLSAANERLSVVLERLAQQQGFELTFSPSADRLVNAELEDELVPLLHQLVAGDGLIVVDVPAPDCEGGRLVEKVFVLNTGEEQTEFAISEPETRQQPVLQGTSNERQASRSEEDRKNVKYNGKRKAEMSPEERYNYEIEKKLRKRYDIEPDSEKQE